MNPLRFSLDMVHAKNFRVWLCIAVYILVIGSAHGAVLCVGTGGHAHIEMEAAGASHCHQGVTADPQHFALHSSTAPTFSCDIERCTGVCKHVPLFIGTPEHLAPPAQSDFFADFPPLGPPSPGAVPMSPVITGRASDLIALPTGSPALALLSSVILLI